MMMNRVLKWQARYPILSWLLGGLCAFLLYYALIVVPLEDMIQDKRSEIMLKEKDLTVTMRLAEEIRRLQQQGAPKQINKTDSAFAQVNKNLNAEGFTQLVTDLHQVNQNRVQVTFNSILFKDLIAWLQRLYLQNGIFVLEANLTKTELGKVKATFTLQGPM